MNPSTRLDWQDSCSLILRGSLHLTLQSFETLTPAVLAPSASALPTSSCLIESGSVRLAQTTLGTIHSTAAHFDGYSPPCS